MVSRLDGWQIADGLTADELMKHDTAIAEGVRISGSDDEARTFDYIDGYLKALGYEVNRYSPEALISFPLSSDLEVLAPERLNIRCNGYSMSPSTGSAGVVGQLVYVGGGRDEDFQNLDVKGKIVLCEGMAAPAKSVVVDKTGALAGVHIDGEYTREMCISPVWGTPTPATAGYLPKTPAVSVTAKNGERLKALLANGTVILRITTETHRGWRPIPVLTADLPGNEDGFVLFSGHVDSWYHGAMDNGTANTAQLAVGRLLAEHRSDLRRGIRLAFWSGHSHGRYAGSAWYADHHWQDLHDNCVCHVNVDSLGGKGADLLSGAACMAETFGFAAELIKKGAGQELEYHRISRSSDQSFWGIGIPSLFAALSEQVGTGSPAAAAQARLLGVRQHGSGLGWWWHTPEDTLDKIDAGNLLRDARIFAAALWELCTRPILPFDYTGSVQEIRRHLQRYQESAGSLFDLESLIGLTESLARSVDQFNQKSGSASDRQFVNRTLMEVGRALVPVNFTKNGPFDQDPAVSIPPLPGLAPVAQLATLDKASDEFKYLKTELVRQRNRVGAALNDAMRTVDKALSAL